MEKPEILDMHIPIGRLRPGTKTKPLYLTIHSTANPTSTAKNERNWLVNPDNNRVASWHVCVDEYHAICAIPLNEIAYHSGTSKGNELSASIEICESGNREKTLMHAEKVTALLLMMLGLTDSALKQHYDWSGKNCPRILRDTGMWSKFVSNVKEALNIYAKQKRINNIISGLEKTGIEFDPNYWGVGLTSDCSSEYFLVLLERLLGSRNSLEQRITNIISGLEKAGIEFDPNYWQRVLSKNDNVKSEYAILLLERFLKI